MYQNIDKMQLICFYIYMDCGGDILPIEEAARQELNDQEVREEREHSREYRLAVMGSVHRAFTTFIRLDQVRLNLDTHRDLSSGQPLVEQYIVTTALEAPFQDDEPIQCLSLKYEDSSQATERSLIVCVPETEGFNLLSDDPQELPEPEVIFVRRIDEKGTPQQWVITPDRVYYYVGANDSPDGQFVEGDTFEDIVGLLENPKVVDERVPLLADIKADLANLRIVTQLTLPPE